jgi:DNA-binding NarL/FixJ family response regulator
LFISFAYFTEIYSLFKSVIPRDQQLLYTNTHPIVLHPPNLLKTTRVLIADDERLFAEALEMILSEDERIEVVGRAQDGHEAVALTRKLDPDVVLMDLSMPGMDGFEAIVELIAEESSRRVVVLSGSADPADVQKAREAGACDYLTKELISEDLVPRVLAAAAA